MLASAHDHSLPCSLPKCTVPKRQTLSPASPKIQHKPAHDEHKPTDRPADDLKIEHIPSGDVPASGTHSEDSNALWPDLGRYDVQRRRRLSGRGGRGLGGARGSSDRPDSPRARAHCHMYNCCIMPDGRMRRKARGSYRSMPVIIFGIECRVHARSNEWPPSRSGPPRRQAVKKNDGRPPSPTDSLNARDAPCRHASENVAKYMYDRTHLFVCLLLLVGGDADRDVAAATEGRQE